MDRQTLRDWVHRFAAGPDGLFDNWTSGPKPRLSQDQLAEFARIVETGPDRKVDGVVRWRRINLKRVIAERFGVDFHVRYVGKPLKKLGFSHMSARPRHAARDERIVEAYKKNFSHTLSARLDGLPETVPIEIWFQMLCWWAGGKMSGPSFCTGAPRMSASTMSRPVVHLALELSVTSWVIAYRLPWSDKVRLQRVCAVKGGAFQWVQIPPGETLQPEATGAVMEVTKWLKPSV